MVDHEQLPGYLHALGSGRWYVHVIGRSPGPAWSFVVVSINLQRRPNTTSGALLYGRRSVRVALRHKFSTCFLFSLLPSS
jgi:hypothetical protein